MEELLGYEVGMLRGTGHRLSKVLNDVALDDRTALLDGLPASVTQQQQLNLLSCTIAPSVSLLGYPEGSVGRIMTIRLHSRPDRVDDRPSPRPRPALRGGQS